MTTPAYRINGESATPEAFYALACDPQRCVAVEACAGAGKTWMLVSRILRALLDGCPPQDILAITFTKKAAGEMRKRLQEWVLSFAAMSDQQLRQELQMRGLDPAQATQRCDELRRLPARLNELGRPVQIRTFHSWFAALLRGAPLAVLQELGLPVQYELLEDDSEAVALTLPRFYAVVAGHEQHRQDFMDCVAEHGRSQTVKALGKALQKRVEFALADRHGVVDVSVDAMALRFPEFSGHADPLQWLVSDAGARACMLEAARSLGQASAKTFSAKGVELEQAVGAGDGAAALAALLTQKDEARKFGEKIVGIASVRAAQDLALRALAAQAQHKTWLHHQRMARLCRVLVAEYGALKRERGWVDMNDVEGAAQRLLGDAELSGWMQQRLDARVRHLLIDEFQDTNPLQWQALYGWLSAYAGAGPGEAPQVFLVGDPKQSIYRFRRAEPQVFKAAQAFVVDGLGGALLSCDHTRRCATGVVDALNSVMLAAQAQEQYAGFRAHTTDSPQAGALLTLPQILRDAKAGADDADEWAWRDSLNSPRVLPEDSYSAIEARQAADWIARELAPGVLQPKDIMVLARKRERLIWLHEALSERGIPCEQPEKQELGDAPAVQDLVALLDALVSTQHDLSLAQALKSPLFSLGDAALAHIARLQALWSPAPSTPSERPMSWWAVLQRWWALPPEQRPTPERDHRPDEVLAEALTQAAATLDRYRSLVQNLPPHDALSSIYQQGDVLARYAQAVPASQRQAVQVQLQALLAQALQLDGGRFLTPYRFVRALRAGGLRNPPVAQTQAVRLLTIHGAKGLEAHTVLLLDADAPPPKPESMGVLVDWPGEAPAPLRFVFLASEKQVPACSVDVLALEQQARALEELNALYVALTRAETRLVISSTEPHQRGSAPSWYQRTQPLASPVDAVEPFTQASHGEGTDGQQRFDLLELPVHQPPTGAEETLLAEPAAALPEDLRDAELDEKSRAGQALHRLMQWRPTPGAGFDWSALHEQAVAREFALSPAQAREAVRIARTMVQGEAAWVWDADLLNHWGNEVELWHQGTLLRLDRLVRRRDTGHWWVLDFKSAMHPERQADLRAQMWGYHAAMLDAVPGAHVRLAFINPQGQVIELV